jgi:hypothetical protein
VSAVGYSLLPPEQQTTAERQKEGCDEPILTVSKNIGLERQLVVDFEV